MAKKTFPITTKAGATAIRIYRSPLRVNPDDRKSKSYDSFLVVHYRGGKRIRTRFKSLELAETGTKAGLSCKPNVTSPIVGEPSTTAPLP